MKGLLAKAFRKGRRTCNLTCKNSIHDFKQINLQRTMIGISLGENCEHWKEKEQKEGVLEMY